MKHDIFDVLLALIAALPATVAAFYGARNHQNILRSRQISMAEHDRTVRAINGKIGDAKSP